MEEGRGKVGYFKNKLKKNWKLSLLLNDAIKNSPSTKKQKMLCITLNGPQVVKHSLTVFVSLPGVIHSIAPGCAHVASVALRYQWLFIRKQLIIE